MRTKLDNKWQNWIDQKHPSQEQHFLNRNKIYVLPTKFGGIFFLMIVSLFIGSVNYQLSSGFFLTFLLMSFAMISAWIGHQNLNKLHFKIQPIADTAVHQVCQIPLIIHFQKRHCFAIKFIIGKHQKQFNQLTSQQCLLLPFQFRRRGHLAIPRIRLETRFPLGLFVVWSYLTFDSKVYVYPEPKSAGFWPDPDSQGNQLTNEEGDEDFYTLKQTDNPWKQPSRISWRTVAKGLGWYEKQYNAPSKTLYLFSIDDIKTYPLEEGLKFISYWLIESEKRGYDYAFRSHSTVQANHGHQHLTQQLRQLATYGQSKS